MANLCDPDLTPVGLLWQLENQHPLLPTGSAGLQEPESRGGGGAWLRAATLPLEHRAVYLCGKEKEVGQPLPILPRRISRNCLAGLAQSLLSVAHSPWNCSQHPTLSPPPQQWFHSGALLAHKSVTLTLHQECHMQKIFGAAIGSFIYQ